MRSFLLKALHPLVASLALLLAALPPGPAVAQQAPADDTLRFVAVGDTGTGTPDQFRVADGLRRVCEARGCDFVLLLGDNFYPAGVGGVDDPLWEERFRRPYDAVPAPFRVVLGNHDYGRNANHLDFRRADPQVAYGRVHANWVLPAPHYAFARGPARFAVLDTTALLVRHGDAQTAQAETMRKALAADGGPWVIAAGHHPYVSNGPNGSAGAYNRLDRPDLDGTAVKRFFDDHLCGRVDLYLAGHEHNLQVLPGPPGCPGLFVISGAGAMADGFARRAGPRKGEVVAVPTHFKAARLGFAYVTVTPRRLTVTVLAPNGRELYRHTLERPQAGG